jgi:hypothetical protein
MAEKNMLIRGVPLDVWERVDRLCLQLGLKRREFIEQALAFFQEGEGQKACEEGAEKEREARARFEQIKNSVKEIKNIIAIKKEIEKIGKEIYLLDDAKTEMNMVLELKRKESELGDLIKKYVPDHNIPDDFEERRKMGLPDRYCGYERIAISRDMDRGFNNVPKKDHDEVRSLEESPAIVDLRRKLEETERRCGSENSDEKQGVNQCTDTTDKKNRLDEDPVRKENDSEIEMRRIDPGDEARSSEKDEGEIETAFFGRGFEDLDGD